MLFKFPQKKIIVDCFTSKEYLLQTAPVVSAIKHMPDWWKQLPSSYLENDHYPTPTMKSCAGLIDFYKNSFVIPLWSDLSIKIAEDKNYSWQFADRESSIHVHNMQNEATNFLNGYGHIKLLAPWFFKEKQGIKFLWNHPTYNYKENNDIITLPGILSYKYQSVNNINLMINRQKPQTILLNYGQPMGFITPLTEKKVEIVRHLVSEEEIKRIATESFPFSFVKKYEKLIKRREEFKGCPYHNKLK